MATFLTTRKMSPELSARVEASVSGRRPGGGSPSAARLVSVLWVGAIALLVIAVSWLYLQRRRARVELEQERSSLIDRVRGESAGLTLADLSLVP